MFGRRRHELDVLFKRDEEEEEEKQAEEINISVSLSDVRLPSPRVDLCRTRSRIKQEYEIMK